jgi:hypothetical protein
MHLLARLLRGVTADAALPADQLKLFRAWLTEHGDLARFHPYNDLVPLVRGALGDGVLERHEVDDLLWVLDKLKEGSDYYALATAEMQHLHGMLAGVTADGVVTMAEVNALKAWLDHRQHLRTIWPFDEVESLIIAVKRDGRIDEQEQRELMSFFSEFASHADHHAVGKPLTDEEKTPVRGLCAARPEVRFDGRTFSFAGTSLRMPRKQIAALIESKGGTFSANVLQDLDYLVVGAAGNPCWAFSCYGRKVEQAIAWRKKGARLVLVHERDFWDAAA